MKKNNRRKNPPAPHFEKGGVWIVCAALLAVGAAGAWGGVLDTMDVSSLWSVSADGSQSANTRVLAEGSSNQAVQLNFVFTSSGTYSQIYRALGADLSELHWPNTKLRFRYEGSAALHNDIKIRMMDSSDRKVYRILSQGAKTHGWVTVDSALGDFIYETGSFDYSRVTAFELTVINTAGAAAGTLDMDGLEIVRSSESTFMTQLFDNFNGGSSGRNAFSGSTGTFTGGAANPASTVIGVAYDAPPESFEGAYALKLTYDMGNTTSTDAGFYSSPNNADLSGYRRLQFYARSDTDNNAFTLTLGSSVVTDVIRIGGIGKTWTKRTASLYDWTALFVSSGGGLNPVSEFQLRFVDDLSAASGNLWLDDIRFVRPALETGLVTALDEMEEPTNLAHWFGFNDALSSVSFSTHKDGTLGRVARISYELKSGGYVGLKRYFYANGATSDGLRFLYKYSSSKANTIQVNIVDSDGNKFYVNLSSATDTGGRWATAEIPFTRFQMSSGCSTCFNLRKITTLYFTVVKDEGGTGTLAVDQVELMSLPKTAASNPGKLLSSVSIDNNPFSPNEDGYKDSARVSYVLGEDSFVRLRIYDMNGSVVREITKPSAEPAGAGDMEWDGTDQAGHLVVNGLYFYQFLAESAVTDGKEMFKNVIVVQR